MCVFQHEGHASSSESERWRAILVLKGSLMQCVRQGQRSEVRLGRGTNSQRRCYFIYVFENVLLHDWFCMSAYCVRATVCNKKKGFFFVLVEIWKRKIVMRVLNHFSDSEMLFNMLSWQRLWCRACQVESLGLKGHGAESVWFTVLHCEKHGAYVLIFSGGEDVHARQRMNHVGNFW